MSLLVVALIVYGSLYPFDFSVRNGPDGPFALLAGTVSDWDRGTDLVSNILLYAPFGLFAIGVADMALPWLARYLLVLAVASLLSMSMELLQFYDVDRVTSFGDVYANVIGTALGAVAGTALGSHRRWPLLNELQNDTPAALIIASWFGYRLYPFVPAADLHKYWSAIRDIVLAPRVDLVDTARFFANWLLIACLIERLYGFKLTWFVFPFLLGCEIVSRILIVNNTLKLADVLGGISAGAFWLLMLRWLPGRHAIFAIAFVAVVAALRLEPFQFSSGFRPFGWIPFLSFMSGSMGVAMQAFLEKAFLYGGMIWLLRTALQSLVAATVIATAVLLVTSYMQTHLPQRSAEITDAVMCVLIGIAFAIMPELLPSSATKSSARTG